MEGSVSRKKDRELTQEMFERLLAWLDKDRDRAGLRYEEIRFQLIKIFVSHECPDSEGLADETINRVARKIKDIADTYTGNPASYFYGVARIVYLEYLRRKPAPLTNSISQETEESGHHTGILRRRKSDERRPAQGTR
jgi:DNA-directed RNA polymerase specialized sigma24 family protein